jgi:hypothetical protein
MNLSPVNPASLISSLVLRLVDSGINKAKDERRLRELKLLAHERIARELFWNLECLSSRAKDEERRVYLGLLRTDAFDELVNISAPLDQIFATAIVSLVGVPSESIPQQLRQRLKGVDRLSMLLDRTYNRIWMLHHRLKNDLRVGDIAYLRQLVKLSLEEASKARIALAGNQDHRLQMEPEPSILVDSHEVW